MKHTHKWIKATHHGIFVKNHSTSSPENTESHLEGSGLSFSCNSEVVWIRTAVHTFLDKAGLLKKILKCISYLIKWILVSKKVENINSYWHKAQGHRARVSVSVSVRERPWKDHEIPAWEFVIVAECYL